MHLRGNLVLQFRKLRKVVTMGHGPNRFVEPLLETPKLLFLILSLSEPDHARQIITAEFLLKGLAFVRAELGQAEII